MKTIQDILKGFETFSTQKLELNDIDNLTYYFCDFSDTPIKSFDGDNYVGYISRYKWDFEMGVKWYTNQTKFESAIKRHLNKQQR